MTLGTNHLIELWWNQGWLITNRTLLIQLSYAEAQGEPYELKSCIRNLVLNQCLY